MPSTRRPRLQVASIVGIAALAALAVVSAVDLRLKADHIIALLMDQPPGSLIESVLSDGETVLSTAQEPGENEDVWLDRHYRAVVAAERRP